MYRDINFLKIFVINQKITSAILELVIKRTKIKEEKNNSILVFNYSILKDNIFVCFNLSFK